MNRNNFQSSCKSESWESVCCLNKRRLVIALAIFEIIGSLIAVGVYTYAAYSYPFLSEYVILPSEFLSDHDLIVGLINALAIFSGFEFILGIVLFDAARYIRLGQLRFWLTSMFTYKIVTCVLIVGLEMSGRCKAPKFNAFMFFTIFIRFVEMLFVFIFLEEEALKRLKLKSRRCREAFSTATSYSNISVVCNENLLDDVVVCTETENTDSTPNCPEAVVNGAHPAPIPIPSNH